MEKTRTLALLFTLAVGSLFLGEASRALSGDVAEDFGGRGSSREARRIASPVVELSAGTRSIATVSVAGYDPDQTYTPTAGELVSAVVTNELTDREKLRKWICIVEKRAGKQTLIEEQVETRDGPLSRLLAIDGTALDPGQRQRDDARIGRLRKKRLSASSQPGRSRRFTTYSGDGVLGPSPSSPCCHRLRPWLPSCSPRARCNIPSKSFSLH